MRDQYFRWAPDYPAEVWLHYRRTGDRVQFVGAQPFGDESLIHFLVDGEGARYSQALCDADADVIAGMVDGWRERIQIALAEPGRYTQLPPNLHEMDAATLERVAHEFAEVEKRRFRKLRAEHRETWEMLYGPTDPLYALEVARRYPGRPDADEDWWQRAHNRPPELVQ